MLPTVRVRFYISGENMDFDVLTKSLDIQPTSVRKKEEWPRPSIVAGLAHDDWEWQTEEEECKAVSYQMDKLQKLLSSKIDILNELQERYSLKTSVTVVIKMEPCDGPELFLPEETIKFLAQIKAEIGFDLYVY